MLMREMRMKPFRIKIDTNVLHANAWGCWAYIQLGSTGIFLGSHMPWGVRFVWNRRWPRIRAWRFS